MRTAQYFPERRERAEHGEEWGRRTEIKAEREKDGRAGRRRLNAATENAREERSNISNETKRKIIIIIIIVIETDN